MADRQYQEIPFALSERPHRYGDRVHLISDPFLLTQLARVCSSACVQPEISRLTRSLYRELGRDLANAQFPRSRGEIRTRMSEEHSEGVYVGDVISPDTKIVIVDLARAGILPSETLFEMYSSLLGPKHVRIDHIFINRAVDEEKRVIGAQITGTKIGGSVQDAVVIVPDPMGATGNSISNVIQFYKETVQCAPSKWILLNLIVTPEYVRKITQIHPDAMIYALRLDRGFSSKRALESAPGTYWDEERGLNHHQYIVPGGGGFGELSSNSFV